MENMGAGLRAAKGRHWQLKERKKVLKRHEEKSQGRQIMPNTLVSKSKITVNTQERTDPGRASQSRFHTRQEERKR